MREVEKYLTAAKPQRNKALYLELMLMFLHNVGTQIPV